MKLLGRWGSKSAWSRSAAGAFLHDRASIYIALADAHTKLNETSKASSIIKKAQKILKNARGSPCHRCKQRTF